MASADASTSRLDTFVDAAFAFSLTLLVISYNQLPDSVDELREALRRLPVFLFCFALVGMFWSYWRALVMECFARRQVRYIHLHNAKRGCFSCRIDRA